MRDLHKDLKGMVPHSLRNKQRKRPIDAISVGQEPEELKESDEKKKDMDAEYATFMAQL